MIRRQLTVLLAFLLIGGGLCYSLVQLFALRMATGGDAYPEYSTLRADPLGTEALFDSLKAIPGLAATRNYLPLPKLKTDGPVALVYLGLGHEARWEEQELQRFETMVAGGSRAIFAFSPVAADDPEAVRRREEMKTQQEEEEKKAGDGKQDLKDLLEPGLAFEEVAQKWGFGFKVPVRNRRERPPKFFALAQADAYGLEPMLPWHTELHFTGVRAPWRTLYRLRGEPVVIERPWGLGSIILSADSYFLSNEGLRDPARPSQFIASLFGAQRTIVFDEEHLGVSEKTNVASLARKYRLHGLVAGLGLIAVLFVWQNIVRFVPPQEEERSAAALVTGRGSSEGFLALLRRSVPPSQLLATCVAEWRRTYIGDPRALDRLAAASQAQATARKAPELVAVFQAMATAVGGKQGVSKQ